MEFLQKNLTEFINSKKGSKEKNDSYRFAFFLFFSVFSSFSFFSSLSRFSSLSLFLDLYSLFSLLSSLFSMIMAMCEVCNVCNVFVCFVMLLMLCCCVMCSGWAARVAVVASCCAVCVRVSFFSLWLLFFVLALKKRCVSVQNAPVCAVKTPVSHKRRSLRERFDSTHGSVFGRLSTCLSLYQTNLHMRKNFAQSTLPTAEEAQQQVALRL